MTVRPQVFYYPHSTPPPVKVPQRFDQFSLVLVAGTLEPNVILSNVQIFCSVLLCLEGFPLLHKKNVRRVRSPLHFDLPPRAPLVLDPAGDQVQP